MKFMLVGGLLFCLIGSAPLAAAQTENGKPKNNQIDMKIDRFSGKATLVLKAQPLIDKPDHYLSLTIDSRVEKSDHPILDFVLVSIIYISSQARTPPDFGDNELHVLVDDKPLKINYGTITDFPIGLDSKYYTEKPHLRWRRTYDYSVLDDAYQSLSKARNIEMRLGPFELKLSPQVTANLREYAIQILEQIDRISPRKNAPRAVAQVKTAGAPQATNDSQAADASQVEVKFWESIQNSSDPKDFEAYIRKYPNGHFVDLANNRIKSLDDSNGAPDAANGGAESTTDNSSNKDEQSQTLKFKLGHQHGGAFSSSYHEGVLSIAPQKIQWEEVGLMSDRDDNFSVSCSDVTGVHVNLREGEPKPETTVADHEYIRLELKDSSLNRKGRKRYSFPVIDISDKETVKAAGEAIQRACPDLKLKAFKFKY